MSFFDQNIDFMHIERFSQTTTLQEMIATLAALPRHLTSVSLKGLTNRFQTPEQFHQLMTVLPPSITTLALDGWDILLAVINSDDLQDCADIFASLPKQLTYLLLNTIDIIEYDWQPVSVVKFGMKSFLAKINTPNSTEKLSLAFSGLPKQVQSLALTNTLANSWPADALCEIIKKLDTITYLSLRNNSLQTTMLPSLFKILPKQITRLDLSNNSLGKYINFAQEQLGILVPLADALNNVPSSLTHLSLAGNHLVLSRDRFSFNSLQSLTHLDLHNNRQSFLQELAFFCQSIPTNITSLNLKGTIHLTDSNLPQLLSALASLPPSLTTFLLDSAWYESTNTEQMPVSPELLATILKHLPTTITTLYDGLERVSYLSQDTQNESINKLLQLFTSLKPTTTALVLQGYLTAYNMNLATTQQQTRNDYLLSGIKDLAQAFKRMPKTVTSLALHHIGFHNLSLTALNALAGCLPYVETIYLSYSDISVMPLRNVAALKAIYPCIKTIHLVDDAGNPLSKDNFPLIDHYRCWAGNKTTPPSLKNNCTFFIKKEMTPEAIVQANLPIELQEQLSRATVLL